MRPGVWAGLLLSFAVTPSALPQEISKQQGRLLITVDTSLAHPGGLLVARLRSPRPLGTAHAILEGRRYPFFPMPGGPRALVPVSATSTPGASSLGIEIRGWRGRRRIPMTVLIAPRDYPPRVQVIPEHKRPLLALPGRVRDGRRLLALLRTRTPFQEWNGPFRPPVGGEPSESFGGASTYIGGSPVEGMMDSVHGEYHRGLDYDVPAGTLVQAPAAGTVLLARNLALTGLTLVLDHGHGVLSALYHLSRIDVREGDRVEGRAPIGLSGDSGLAATPHLHWGVYVHGVAVDPRALERLPD